MSAIGMMLAGGVAHATLFAIAGMVAYLVIRRWGPAAGSLAAGSSLAIMATVSVTALSPWPRWRSFGDVERPSAAAGAREAPVAASPAGASPTTPDPPSPARPVPTPTAIELRPSLLGLFLDELRRPASAPGAEGWGWREWLAAGFLASLALGAARLGLGLRGVAWLRARSRPVEDRGLDELLRVLVAELGCTRRVALREAPELTTPATIGWRHPVVLLPFDWRDWDDDERRAVLAHELAHVRRGDFPVGVVAQVAVAMHFYHPLAHWLAARLRLEQELAADAWGARLSGGQSSYLATLAQMALRRDGHALTWPARAFLPSHDTFVRRIEMLKNHGPIRNVTLPPAARALTVAALAAVGLLVAGLRGPAGDSPALAQDREVQRPGPAAASDAHNLTWVPDDARMVVSLRPATLLGRREVRRLLDSLRDGPWLKQGFPIPPEDIEQVLVFWVSEPAHGGSELVPPPSGLVFRTSKPQDWRAALGKLAGPSLGEAKHDGQTYFRLHPGASSPWGVYAPDERTAVAAEEFVLQDRISDRQAPMPGHPWDEAWRRVAKGQLMVAIDMRWFRRQVARYDDRQRSRAAALGLETFAPLYEKARSYAASFNASDQSLAVDIVAAAGSPENARPVAETLQAILTLGRNAVTGLRRDADRPRPAGANAEAAEWMLQAADSVLEKARVETTEGFVRLHADANVDLAEGIRLLTPAVAAAQAARRRTQSVMNLKQIGLAFHNYYSANGHFPAAVNRDKGQFPYSWRVAILPYIEQQGLYNQYRFNEPWDGPNNIKLIDKMPAIYAYPGPDGTPSSRSNPSYFVFTGDSTIGGAEGGAKIEQITDGTSNTILAVEARRDIPWTKPEDIPFDPKAPLPELGGFTPDGVNALFADGSVRYIKKSINATVLKAVITRDAGEVISADMY